MRRTVGLSIDSLLQHAEVRRFQRDGRTWFAAADIVAVLSDAQRPDEVWRDLQARESMLARWVESIDGVDVVDLDGVLRLVQAVPSAKAERLKWWLAESARRRLEEADNPQLAFLRARKLYESRGYPRRWVDKRLGGVGSRHELTAEWYKRGARRSEDFRALTNQLMTSAFGMDVARYRAHKGLAGRRQTLRDSMTGMELTLTTLAETTAAAISRSRNSQGLQQLMQDAKDAGEIAARTLAEIQRRIPGDASAGASAEPVQAA